MSANQAIRLLGAWKGGWTDRLIGGHRQIDTPVFLEVCWNKQKIDFLVFKSLLKRLPMKANTILKISRYEMGGNGYSVVQLYPHSLIQSDKLVVFSFSPLQFQVKKKKLSSAKVTVFFVENEDCWLLALGKFKTIDKLISSMKTW